MGQEGKVGWMRIYLIFSLGEWVLGDPFLRGLGGRVGGWLLVGCCCFGALSLEEGLPWGLPVLGGMRALAGG